MAITIETVTDKMEMILSDARGIYIPKNFVQMFFDIDGESTGNVCDRDGIAIGDSDDHDHIIDCVKICFDPYHEEYWDAWTVITDNVHVFKLVNNGMDKELFSLYQNGDLYAIPIDDVKELSEEEQDEFWESLMY